MKNDELHAEMFPPEPGCGCPPPRSDIPECFECKRKDAAIAFWKAEAMRLKAEQTVVEKIKDLFPGKK